MAGEANIKTLFNFEPPATEEEIQAASLQFVRKLSGFNKPSKINDAAFERAVDDVACVAEKLLSLVRVSNRERSQAAANVSSKPFFTPLDAPVTKRDPTRTQDLAGGLLFSCLET